MNLPDPMSSDEVARLDALDRYGVLDTGAEPAFDRIVDLARALFDTPVAIVSFVDQTRQWFKARTGLDVQETSRAIAFCDHAIRTDEVMVVNDASADDRFADNPLVTGDPNIRFYAGAPIRTPDGHRLGTVCILSPTPRQLSPADRARLDALAGIASHELELRLQTRRMARAAQEQAFLLQEVDHRLDHSLHLIGHVLQEQARNHDSPNVRRALLAAADRVVTIALVNRGLRTAGDTQQEDAADYLLSLCSDLQEALLDGLGGRRLKLDIGTNLPLPPAQRPRLGFIVSELISNAIKHGRGTVELTATHDGRQTLLSIRDEGDGFGIRHSGPDPEWGPGLRLVAALCGGTVRVDRADRHRLLVTMPDLA